MKKLVIACEIFILFVCVTKIALVFQTIKSRDIIDNFLSLDQASAKTSVINNKKFDSISKSSKEEGLILSLLQKEKQIKENESYLISEKKRLNSLKNEILSKFNKLRTLEEKLGRTLEQIKEIHDERYKKLAKVYESTPPAQASAMLEKLDKKTAAAIIMNMRTSKAGAIWGYIDPERGVEITKEIANIDRLSKKSKIGPH